MENESFFTEALEHLRTLIRLDTTNPPGNEIIAASYLKSVLEKEGLSCSILESAPRRANLVARMDVGNPEKALIMSSHLDVVPAESEKWTHPPFEGAIADDFLWGRGTLDMKQMTIFSLMSFLRARRENLALTRDLVFLALADEEAGSRMGAEWMVQNHPDLLKARFALNEVGGFRIVLKNKLRVYPIQVSEKGFVWLKMTCYGEPGHGSIPSENNAVVKLARAIDKLHTTGLGMHKSPIAVHFIRSIGKLLGIPEWAMLELAMNAQLSNLLFRTVLPDRDKMLSFYAMLHNTATPTELKAGIKSNVIPGEASATLDCRIIPGQTPSDLVSELHEVVGPDFHFDVIAKGDPTVFDHQTDLYQTIEGTLQQADPGCHVLPFMVTGFTDASQLTKLGVTVYGFTPVQLPPELSFQKLMHAHDERIWLPGFRWGLETFYSVIKAYCTA